MGFFFSKYELRICSSPVCPVSSPEITVLLLQRERGRYVELTAHLQLMPSSGMLGPIPSLSHKFIVWGLIKPGTTLHCQEFRWGRLRKTTEFWHQDSRCQARGSNWVSGRAELLITTFLYTRIIQKVSTVSL